MPDGSDHPANVFMRYDPNERAEMIVKKSGLDLLGELADRMGKLEDKMASIQADMSRFREQGGDLDIAHVRHVMQKHFFHDQPEPAPETKAA